MNSEELSEVNEHKRLIFQCFCFGYTPGNRVAVQLTRLAVMVLFMLCHIPIQRYKWSNFTCLLFSLIYSSIIVIFLLILYFISKLVNKTFEMSSDSLEDIPTESPPPGISKILWAQRNLYSFEEDKLQQTAFDLINSGFQPSEVYALAEFMKDSIAGEVAQKHKNETKHNYLRIGSKIMKFPLSNKSFFEFFPFPRNLFYILLVYISLIIQLFLVAKESHLFPSRDYFWLCIVSGACIYSTIQPPPTEYYSLTYGHLENGIARPFYLSLVLFFMYLTENLYNFVPKIVSHLNLDISLDYDSFVPFLINVFKIFIYAAPLISICMLLQPSLVILYLLEGINRFVLGYQGSPSLLLGILQTIKGVLVGIISHFIYKWNNKFNTCVLIIVAFVVINIPFIRFDFREFLVFVWNLILTTGFSILHTFYYQKDANRIVATVVILLDAAAYYCSTNAQYNLIFIRFERDTKIVNKIIYFVSRLVNQYVLCFLIFKEILEGSKYPTWLYGIFVSNMINVVSSNTLCFAVSYTFRNLLEIDFHTPIFDYFLCNWLAHKAINAYSIIYIFLTKRTAFSARDDDTFEFDEALGNTIGIIGNHVPFIDRVVNVPQVFVSILLNFLWNTLNADKNYGVTEFLMAPRPNVFWSAFPSHSSVGITKLDLKESPVEGPSFMLCYRFLQKWLCYAVQSGMLGLVDENSIYLFKSDNCDFFVHIISLTPSAVYFQLRGLELDQVGACHTKESRFLTDIQAPWNCFYLGLTMLNTNFNLIKPNIEMMFYQIRKTDLNSVLLVYHSNLENAIDGILTDFCMRNVDILHQVETNSEEDLQNDQFPQNLGESRNNSNIDPDHHESEDQSENSQREENNENQMQNQNPEPQNQNHEEQNNAGNPQNQPQNPENSENNEIHPEINERINERIIAISREVKRLIFNYEPGFQRLSSLNTENFYYLFSGNTSHTLNTWLVNHEHLMSRIVRPTIQTMFREIINSSLNIELEDFQLAVVASIDSIEFKRAIEKRKPVILTMIFDRETREVKSVIYYNSVSQFQCFKMNSFDVFSLWATDIFEKTIGVQEIEKLQSWYNLTKHVISAVDRPFGTVAYASPVGVSYNNFIV
ncbi:hypothetical protein TVAG_174210 [Trichomonas vaginalis G3]|uniref:Pecanex C-terminal domain-containing protein n=1 Tax=Trichomonas vaginalis (strain ATCC PRA-98 / G3) TaxID=412133 RepID=A2EWW4_TRIV3|nr:pecanex family [Trichomonas vaginalis G3]EAY02879.1 hypothetical protein TVAG_174210 [Trichomonas vaginalis G3]KAI5497393.1 pecanex family [Trichomonas vaginalis G3]|eukprot:XP_001315102.1 hypothetical protein [Trichomonas vaginalis G3]